MGLFCCVLSQITFADELHDKKAIVYTRNSDSYKQLIRLSKYNKLENFGGQTRGHILLQGHGNEVSFKNIMITIW